MWSTRVGSLLRLVTAMLFGALALSTAGRAGAAPTARLDYQRASGAEACPDVTELRRAVRERLGYDPFVVEADQTMVATIRPEGPDLRGEVRLVDAAGKVRGSRELRAAAPECAELVSRMALAISIAIDPQSLDRLGAPPNAAAAPSAETEAAPAPAPALAASPAPSSRPEPIAPPRPAKRRIEQEPPWVAEFAIGAQLATGLTPKLAIGPSVAVGIRRGFSSLTLEGHYLLVDDVQSSAGRVESTLGELGLVPCFRPALALLCAQVSLGRLWVRGKEVARSRTDTTWVPRVGPVLGVDLPLVGVLKVRPQVAALVALSRPKVALAGQTVWESPAIGAFASLSVLGHFP
jgi:hypothetical protein